MKECKLLFGDNLKNDIDFLINRTEEDEIVSFLVELREKSEEKLDLAKSRNPECRYVNAYMKVEYSDRIIAYVKKMASELPEKSDLKLFAESIAN